MLKELSVGAAAAVVLFLILQGYNVFPFLFIAVIGYFLYQTVGPRAFTRSFLQVKAERDGAVTFDDVGGQAAAKKELLEALEFVRNMESVRRLGIRPLKGILLSGPPGTGKTLLARAAATHTGSAFIAASGSEFIEVYAGVGAQRVRSLFQRARELGAREARRSAVIFIDEIEVLGGKRGIHSGHLEYDQTLNQLLVEMDGLGKDDSVRVLVIGATNRGDLLDPALLRPGRFDRIVRLTLPDREERLEILKLHVRGKPLGEAVNLEQVAAETFGFSGAHLESLANEAAILAMREESETIEPHHFSAAVDKVIMGEKLKRRPRQEELRRVAFHEAGHAVVSELVEPGSVSSVTVASRDEALGYIRKAAEADQYLQTQRYLEEQIMVLLAGAVAEDTFLGGKSTGAAADYEKAVDLAKLMIATGMSSLGVVCPDSVPDQLYHETLASITGTQERAAREALLAREEALRRVVDLLLEKESVGGDELRALLQDTPGPGGEP